MTRRITWTFLTLITALLVLAVVPLGLSMAANERSSFRFSTQDLARLVASAAEEYLGDHGSRGPVEGALASAASHGYCAVVYTAAGSQVVATRCLVAASAAGRALAASVTSDTVKTSQQGEWLLIAVPVGDSGAKVGTVVFARSADQVNDRIASVWAWLTLMAVAGLAAGALLSARLARWVSRPLSQLGDAASRIGDGDLAARAAVDGGPVEVRRLAGTFNRMATRNETLVHGYQVWVADVSHQLRTPLTALRLRLDLLASDVGGTPAGAGTPDGGTPDGGMPDGGEPGAAKGTADLAGAREEVTRLSRLLDGLLAVARAEAAVPHPEAVDVGAVVADRVGAWHPVAWERGISLVMAPDGTRTAHLGSGHLEQMLDNILANALEAVADQGAVRVESTGRQGRAIVRVIDNGPGMGQAAKDAAFRRFASPSSRGNGIGLAIVSRLASANGGGVRLLDTPGGGLTVELDLPAPGPPS